MIKTHMGDNARRAARNCRWHLQNALERLAATDSGAQLELAAGSLMDAAKAMFDCAIQARGLYENQDAGRELGDDTAERNANELVKKIYNDFFAALEPAEKIEL